MAVATAAPATARVRTSSRVPAEITLLLNDLNSAQRRIEQWLDEGHGESCECSFCSSRDTENLDVMTQGERTEEDMKGLRWTLYNITAIMESGLN